MNRFQVADHLSSYLCEPHAAVLAARLTQTLAQTYNLAAVAHDVPYLTGDQPTQTPLAADFAVLEEMPFDRKRLKSWLRIRRIGHVEIKIRGLQLDPESLSRQLKLDGDEAATILIYRGDRQARAVVAQRIDTPAAERSPPLPVLPVLPLFLSSVLLRT